MKFSAQETGGAKILRCLKKVIAFQSGTNTVGVVPNGAVIEKVEVGIRTAFNGSGAALNIGKTGALDTYLATAAITEATPGAYSSYPNSTMTADTTILATLTDTDGTTGDGTVFVWFSV